MDGSKYVKSSGSGKNCVWLSYSFLVSEKGCKFSIEALLDVESSSPSQNDAAKMEGLNHETGGLNQRERLNLEQIYTTYYREGCFREKCSRTASGRN